jgi:hypothetical protein
MVRRVEAGFLLAVRRVEIRIVVDLAGARPSNVQVQARRSNPESL